jgi:hypothetical protein
MRRARGPSQLGELSTRWRLHQTEAQRAGGTLDVHSVEEKHVEVDVEVIPGIRPSTPEGPAYGCSKSFLTIL